MAVREGALASRQFRAEKPKELAMLPVPQLVDALLQQALQERASDIHIEPATQGLRVRFRIDGMLREKELLPLEMQAAVLSRIKLLSALDIAEKRLPQDGRWRVQKENQDVDVRVSTLPVQGGEKAVLRILPFRGMRQNIETLGFSKDALQRYRLLYQKPQGIILICGPTGSGKTTTLYATLAELNRPESNLVSIEDPVELQLAGMNQVQVNAKAGLTFATALRAILRQDPNIIMVGEIRDAETADAAVRAAMTGHLVFSTLHTNDAAGAVARLLDLGVPPFLVATSLLGVVAQRLVRLVCQECRQSYRPAEHTAEEMLLKDVPEGKRSFVKGCGCAACGQTGYRGRQAIYEVMPVTSRLRQLIQEKAAAYEIAAAAREEGMHTMSEDGVAKAAAGLTSLSEVVRVAAGMA
ncbi:MAG: GspE/PulE family protein [Anaeromusa sp.]|uniref:GspE/PulE family protein n=1 Tax=Anaeromusa sp. TaxID=1872520 RepID=UPI002B20259D|nr:GspE/PulE family protein [Anaeromusa sp.]MEA4833677.1 GspE/PulE family protein [Anaeromusa sp.]